MTGMLQEFCDSRGVSIRIDRPASVIRGVKVLGLESRNGRTYLPEALSSAVSLYEDAKVNVNHPKGNPSAPRDYQDRIGVIRNVTARAGQGLFADFHFNPRHALAEQLLWDAEHAPENVGFSHNVEARTARRGEQVVVEAITRVQSVDLVADPATTRSLFESADTVESADAGRHSDTVAHLTLEELKHAHPQLVESLQEEPTAELQRLRFEVEQLRALESLSHKRETAYRLIREFGLPDPASAEPWNRIVCGDQFIESLLTSADEAAMRRIVGERARLVWAIRQQQGTPQASDQHRVYGSGAGTAKSFVEAIT